MGTFKTLDPGLLMPLPQLTGSSKAEKDWGQAGTQGNLDTCMLH